MRRITIALALLATAACGESVSAPTPTIPAPTAGMVSETFTGAVGSGDPRCTVGLAPYTLDEGPCQVFGPISTSGGRIDAMLTYALNDPALRFQLYDPTSGGVVAFGRLTFDPFNSVAHSTLNLISFSAGRYQLRVIQTGQGSTAFTIVTTH